VMAMLAGDLYYRGPGLLMFVYDHFVGLVTTCLVVSVQLSIYLYASSFHKGKLLATHGNTGNHLYDFFIGRELNPRAGRLFDIKSFCELLPGMTLWVVFDVAFLVRQFLTYGRVTDSMVLVCAGQIWYVVDALYSEPAILTTMDITTDGFGYMLAFGDLVWVPCVYSLQARYLASHPVDLGYSASAAIVALFATGYYIFRGANGQKNAFRRDPADPSVRHLRFIETKSGSKLLVSGFWGVARHINYLGDWMMGWSWCLPTGFATPVTYFYVAFFHVLLLHRERRDEAKCKAKYGDDWARYQKIVKWRIIPGVY